ncbi:MAG: hypothetical protein IKP28_01315 [Clostridia bacterium]|nr:hypothetical protein [Clostridia bacterium]
MAKETKSGQQHGYREPDITTGDASAYGIEGINNILGTNAESFDEELETAWRTELTTNFYNMAKSVAKYKGFYIARYEAGKKTIDTTTTEADYTSYKGQVTMSAAWVSKAWYGFYQRLRGTKSDTNSTMIWGCQYDQVMRFIGEETEIGHNDRGLAGSLKTSGAVPKDLMKNIYDLEGNYFEWTVEAQNTSKRIFRANAFDNIGSNHNYYSPNQINNYREPNFAGHTYGARATLYL